MPEIHISAVSKTDDKIAAGQVLGFNRQCSIGYHEECSDPDGETCRCPCHVFAPLVLDAPLTLVQLNESTWINPDQVLCVRDRGKQGGMQGARCEVLTGQTGFIIYEEATTVVAKLTGRDLR